MVKDDRDLYISTVEWSGLTAHGRFHLYKPPGAARSSIHRSLLVSNPSLPRLDRVRCFGLQGYLALCFSSKRRPEPTRGSRQELANQRQGAAAPRDTAAAAELAEITGCRESEEQRGKFLVLRLYEALNSRDARRAQELLAPDLEWWFHGPPAHQHMMRLLTGADTNAEFRFSPRSVDAFGSTVIAEGADDAGQLYWVHAWTVGPDGVITQLREYFNTDLTVTRLSAAAAKNTNTISPNHSSPSSSTSTASASGSSSSSPASAPSWPKCLWQSRRSDRAHKSLPGLVLAI